MCVQWRSDGIIFEQFLLQNCVIGQWVVGTGLSYLIKIQVN